jgi:hypothetical protein
MPRVAIENTLMYDITSVDAAKTPAGLMDISSYISGYPLMSSKRRDFETFAAICRLLEGRKHLSREGLREIASLAVTMNPSGKRRFKLAELIDYTST